MPPGCHLFTGMCQFLLSLCGFLKSFFRVKLTHCQALTEERCSGKACSVCAVFESRGHPLILISFLSGRQRVFESTSGNWSFSGLQVFVVHLICLRTRLQSCYILTYREDLPTLSTSTHIPFALLLNKCQVQYRI